MFRQARNTTRKAHALPTPSRTTPIAERTTLEHQAGGEQQKLDEDFLVALEHGMPPAGGIGIDHLEHLPKVISETVGQICRFASIPGRESPPFQKLLLATAIFIMLLDQESIRDVILFPQLKPK